MGYWRLLISNGSHKTRQLIMKSYNRSSQQMEDRAGVPKIVLDEGGIIHGEQSLSVASVALSVRRGGRAVVRVDLWVDDFRDARTLTLRSYAGLSMFRVGFKCEMT